MSSPPSGSSSCEIVRGETDEAHPDVFNKLPPEIQENKPGQLSREQLKQFFTEGYLIVANFFKREELDACRDAVKIFVDELAEKFYKDGKIKKLYKEYGLFQRLTHIEKEFPGANILLHKQGTLPKAIRDLWSNERLLNLVEQMVGPDIIGHPIWNLRTKTPKNEATTVPWHQDVGYLDNDAYKVLQPTAWIPLLDTTEHNGCMQVIGRGHKTGRVATHQCCSGGTWYVMIDENEMEKKLDVNLNDDVVTCEVPYRGMLLINNLIPHRSLNNFSNDVRWSLDLRWQDAKKPLGFYGMKEGVLMRSSKDPNLKIDWESFTKKTRQQMFSESLGQEEMNYDTTIQGPWMRKWDIVHHNGHTEKLTDETITSWHGHKAHRP